MLGFGLGVWPNGTLQVGGPAAPPPPPPTDGSALAYNTGLARVFSSNRPFLNLAKLATYWAADNGAAVTLDGDFYPTGMPAGASYLFSTLNIGAVETGLLATDIHVFWEGDGALTLGDGGTVQLSEANHFVFSPTTGVIRFDITAFGTTGVANMRVVRDDHLALFMAGEVYNPDWLSIVSSAGLLRFLNWLSVNGVNSDQIWADRPTQSRYSYLFRMPYEIIIDVCNRVGADLWVQTAHRVDQVFVESLAALVRDTLDPSLTCYVEYTNETWNTFFDQTEYFIARGAEDWGQQAAGTVTLVEGSNTVIGSGTAFLTDFANNPAIVAADGQFLDVLSVQSDTEFTTKVFRPAVRNATDVPIFFDTNFRHRSSYVKYATQFAKWWRAIHPTRCKHLLGGQVASGSDVTALIAAADWQANEPLAWEERNIAFDGVAVSTYFGNSLMNSTIIAELNAALATSEEAMLAVLDGYLRDPAFSTSLPDILSKLRSHHRACRAAGLEVYAYEGGWHGNSANSSTSGAEQDDALGFFNIWVQSDDCTSVFNDLLEIHKAFIDGPFMQFEAVGDWGRSGAWGAYRSPDYAGDKRTEFLETLSDAGRFWGPDLPPQLIKPLPVITGTEFETISLVRLDLCFTANTATYSSPDLPDGLTIDPATGDITGFLVEGSMGSGTYTVVATSAGGGFITAVGAYEIDGVSAVDLLDPSLNGVYFQDMTDEATIAVTTPPNMDSITDKIGGYTQFNNSTSNNIETGVHTINGHNTLTFPGKTFTAGADNVQALSAGVTLYFIYERRNSGTIPVRRPFSFGSADNFFSLETLTNGDVAFDIRIGSTDHRVAVTPTAGINDPRLVTLRYDGADILLTVNGVSASIPATGDINIDTNQATLGTGRANTPWFGHMAGLFIANAAHSDQQMADVEAYLTARFALSQT